VASAGCTLPAGPSVTDELQGLVVGGTPRWYLLTTPAPTAPSPPAGGSQQSGGTAPGDVTPRPLVLDFHGVAESAVVQADTSQFGALGQRDGFVVVTPSGTGDPIHWDTTDQGADNPDLQFVTALITQVEATQCIDTSRVYATGFSDGAAMASLLACTMSAQIAAIGAVSGLELPEPCDAGRAVPLIAFHGTADPILYFNGGADSAELTQLLGPEEPTLPASAATRPVRLDGPGVPTTVRQWAVKEGCGAQPVDTRVGTQVIVRRYSCPSGTDVRFTIIVGGGHDWPGSVVSSLYGARSGMTTFQVNATEQTWEFFQQFHL
jgi:polyhydroxybutyrate depolymerase